MILYHFTAIGHLPDIFRSGYLDVTESNIGAPAMLDPNTAKLAYGRPTGKHLGPDVLWAFDREHPRLHGQRPMLNQQYQDPLVNKTNAVFVIDVDDSDVAHWPTWCEEQGISKRWRRHLAKSGDENQWWVVLRQVPALEWLAVRAKIDGEWVHVNEVDFNGETIQAEGYTLSD